MKINRRRFITLIGLALIGLLAMQYRSLTFQGLLYIMLKKDVNGMGFKDNDLEKFMVEANAQNLWNRFSMGKRLLIYLHYYSPIKGMFPFYWKYKQYRGFVTGQFLLSTNYFWRIGQSDIALKYLGVKSPYLVPCQHPFMNL
jgi:hypothetical protein